MQSDRSRLIRKSLWAFVSLLIIYAICFVWIDKPLAFYAQQTFTNTALFHFSADIKKVASPEHWLILGVISTIIGFILKRKQHPRASAWLLFGISMILSFVACGIFKTVLARYRPIELFQHQLYGFHWFSIQHNFNSTPSGHVTAAAAGFCALARIYGRTWYSLLAIVLVVIIAASRIIESDHFLSDVIFAGYVGVLSVLWTEVCFKLKKASTSAG